MLVVGRGAAVRGGVDVLVVGGGPSGSATAALLARAGWSVAVLERAVLPRPKPCGECLNPGAVAALGRIGMLDAVLELEPARIHGWVMRAEGAAATGDFSAAGSPGLGVPRERLDEALLAAARREGAVVHEGVTVREVGAAERGGRTLGTREPDGSRGERRARVIVGADGLRSVTARAVGALRRGPRIRKLSLTGRLYGRARWSGRGILSVGPGGTVGFAPVQADATLWNLTVVVDAVRAGRAAAGSPLDFMIAAARSSPAWPEWEEGPEVVAGPWASGPFDWPTRTVADDALVLVGDASGYFDPLTGQGIHQALRSAELAAEAIDSALRAGRVSRADFQGYARRHREAFAPGRALQHAIEQVLSRASLRGPMVRRLAARPAAFDALLAVTGDHLPARSLLRPGFLAALLAPLQERRPGRI